MQSLSNQKKGSLLAFIGVLFITPDSLLIRLSNIETWGLLFYRGFIPFIVVLFGLILFYKTNFFKALINIGYTGIFYAISFSVCNITFIISIQNTTVANTLIMVAMAPMLSAFLGALFLKEAPDKKTWLAIIITFFTGLLRHYLAVSSVLFRKPCFNSLDNSLVDPTNKALFTVDGPFACFSSSTSFSFF